MGSDGFALFKDDKKYSSTGFLMLALLLPVSMRWDYAHTYAVLPGSRTTTVSEASMLEIIADELADLEEHGVEVWNSHLRRQQCVRPRIITMRGDFRELCKLVGRSVPTSGVWGCPRTWLEGQKADQCKIVYQTHQRCVRDESIK
jgi:hypothetical protein